MSNTRHALADRKDDYYSTPLEAVQALLAFEPDLPLWLWDPCCGAGEIVLPLRAAGRYVWASDLVDRGCPDSKSRIDFLLWQPGDPNVQGIVMNPPFKLIDAFVLNALEKARYVAIFGRLNFLAGAKRKRAIFDRYPPARIHLSSKRLPMMHRDGWDGPKNGSMMDFAWFVWDRRHSGPPTLNWFDWREFSRTTA